MAEPNETQRFGLCSDSGSISAMTNLDEQFLIAHPSEVTAMDANVGQLFGPNPSLLPGEREGSLSQRWL